LKSSTPHHIKIMQFATKQSGYAPLDLLTINRANASSSATPQLPLFNSVHVTDPAARSFVVGRLARFTHQEHRQIQQRCIAAAAQAKSHARRRALMALVLCLLGVAVGAVVMEREMQMQRQMVEVGQ
jgi:hypothetical protein